MTYKPSVSGISGGPIETFREGWALLPVQASMQKPHFWRRIELSNRYIALCGLKGALATAQQLHARGMPHAQSIKPLEPGIFMVDRCKLCARKHHKSRVTPWP